MSPRWGFRIFACPMCYKHAAPLGLGWFISNEVDYGKSTYRGLKPFQVRQVVQLVDYPQLPNKI